ncbi:hypothetical protein BD324DRAFT_639621 [Kockovaella imperatae]|uniref:Thioredoxin-like fold domain-containing protein n=1 Tax=Kockovaella imperatae TaxID=4999 RepID=A0A1Y1U649_9TREE|nr:hypothetical protein BD324DRAFT_639621 [Kockovaella imperatae]ORX33510.1 hypothetical protein BD324DRAFT_639621 [Kockovaella imperatae]
MALPRSLSFQRLGSGPQVLEVYLCPTCPFSGKIARALSANVLPLITKGGKYEGRVSLIPRLYPQPFHYTAQFQCEALVWIGTKYPELYWDYFLQIYEHIEEFGNVPAQNMTPLQTREKLFSIAQTLLEKNGKLKGPASQVHASFMDSADAVKRKAGDEYAKAVEAMLKSGVKLGRQNGIHVTPTVLFDGIRDDFVSSSWGKEEWEDYLAKKMQGI